VDRGAGTLTFNQSLLYNNPSGTFQNAPGVFDSVDIMTVLPTIINSTVS
jgi:hypothetical protein